MNLTVGQNTFSSVIIMSSQLHIKCSIGHDVIILDVSVGHHRLRQQTTCTAHVDAQYQAKEKLRGVDIEYVSIYVIVQAGVNVSLSRMFFELAGTRGTRSAGSWCHVQ